MKHITLLLLLICLISSCGQQISADATSLDELKQDYILTHGISQVEACALECYDEEDPLSMDATACFLECMEGKKALKSGGDQSTR